MSAETHGSRTDMGMDHMAQTEVRATKRSSGRA